jgi:hypothetical protein
MVNRERVRKEQFVEVNSTFPSFARRDSIKH